ncbi:MAG: single-stranded-DNA-specific exonuclease RecJ [Verrucomicrobiales bacterium]
MASMEAEREWRVRDLPGAALDIVRQCEAGRALPRLVQRLIALRGFAHENELAGFLSPRLEHLSDPFLLPHMRDAVDRLFRAIDLKESVVLYGDYDVDGISSLAILRKVFDAYGLETRLFLPHRLDEGYGLSEDGLRRCLAEGVPRLLMAVDCGTGSAHEIAGLREQGIDVIVLDHHEPGRQGVPPGTAVVNPKLGPAFRYLCTAGLAFKLGHAMLKTRPLTGFDLRELLDLVALGTVADVVPLIGENRLLVTKGLQQLSRTRHAGLHALKAVAGLRGMPRAADIAFRLGPRLNAAGRLDTAQAALDLLLSQQSEEALGLAQELDRQNRQRQNVQALVQTQAETLLEQSFDAARDFVILLGSAAWHPGVVGIVAGRLVRRYRRPAFVVAFDETGMGKGSGRSVEGISLVAALDDCRELLVRGGGHAMAAGLTVSTDSFAALRARLEESVRRQLGGRGFAFCLNLDAEVELAELDLQTLHAYERLEPFGCENPAPVLLARGVVPAGEPKLCREKHRRFVLRQNHATVQAIWFDSVHRELPAAPWDVALTIQRGEYRGQERLEIHIADMRSAI